MDPPLVNPAPFSGTDSPASYNWAEFLSFPVIGSAGLGLRMGGELLMEESTVTEQRGSLAERARGKRKRVDGNSADDESSKHVSTSTTNNGLNESTGMMITSRSIEQNGDSKNENLGNCGTPSQGKTKTEQSKDFIHVRARRGQATDSHSLAERARREKISERMRILQDLVPGCNKVVGKALVLDEIINYIQSLQQQVEFLSMKLGAVTSRMNLTLAGFPSKDLAAPAFEANEIMFGSQPEYAQGTQAERLHMQVGFQRGHR